MEPIMSTQFPGNFKPVASPKSIDEIMDVWTDEDDTPIRVPASAPAQPQRIALPDVVLTPYDPSARPAAVAKRASAPVATPRQEDTSVRARKQWPFKDIGSGGSLMVYEEDYGPAALICQRAHIYGYNTGKQFRTRVGVDSAGRKYVHVMRVGVTRNDETGEPVKVDRRSLRRVKYAYEDLSVGEYVEYRDGAEAQRAVSSIANRQRKLGMRFAVKRVRVPVKVGGATVDGIITQIHRVE
jgi:hypothetical protein